MHRFILALLACLLPAGPALADLSRLAVDVEAPRVTRPAGAIVGVRVQGLSGQAGRITTFGQAFREGDWPRGTGLTASHEGRALAMQYDIKARHDDGSVRHAILSIRNPAGTGDAQIALAPGPAQNRPALDIRRLVERDYALTLDMTVEGQRATVDAGALLRAAVQGGRLDRWLSGPLASEVRVSKRLTPSMTAVFDIRALADGGVRTAVSVHHDDMMAVANRDIDTTYTIRLGGQSVAQRQVKHLRYTNWREIVWGGAQPSTAHVVFDMPYLIAAGAVPPYDPTIRIDRSFYTKQIEAVAKGGTGPMASASILRAMPTTGGRGDIGMVPDWTYAWLRAQSPATRAAMMANAEAAGAVPWHFRDPQTGRVPTLDDRPKFWADYRANEGKNGHPPIKVKTEGWKLDNAHQPDLSYVPYLVTGDRYHLDELHAQLGYGLLNYNPRYRGDAAGNLSNDQVYNYTRRYQLNRFLRADFNGRWSTAYRVIHSDENTKVPYATWAEIARVNIAAGKFEPQPAEMMGNPAAAWNYVAQARAGYASMVGAFMDPFIAEAYAYLVRDSIAMHGEFAERPKWSMVPVFPDGSILPIANHRAVSGRAVGTAGNDLLAGGGSGDALAGGPGNDILAGFDGGDVLASGGGIDLLAGGRGDDRLYAEGGRVLAAGGPGRDVFYVGISADGRAAGPVDLSIADFRPGTDRLSFPPALGSAAQVMATARSVANGTYIPTGQTGGVLLHGVRADALRPDSFAAR